MKFIKLLLLTIMCVGVSGNMYAQGIGKIGGIIKDSTSKANIDYATISIINPADSSIINGSLSQNGGRFVIDKLPFGKWNMKISFMGYKTIFYDDVTLSPQRPAINAGTISMMPAVIETDGVTVEGERETITYEVDKKVINVDKDLTSKGGTAQDVLQNLPSIRVDIEGNVSLRGSTNFQLLIDGKPTILSAKELLNQLPASSIDNIEIITNPSAKYDPEGVSGIINIITKKNALEGLSALLNTTTGTRDKYSGNMNVNYQTGNWNLITGLSYNNQKYHPESDYVRETYTGDSTLYVKPYIARMHNPNNYSFKLGADYNLNDDQTFMLMTNIGFIGFIREMPSEYSEWTNYNSVQDYYFNNDFMDMGGDYFSGSLNHEYRLKQKDHKLNTSIVYNRWDGGFDQDNAKFVANNDFSDNTQLLSRNKIDNYVKKDVIRIKSDYTLPLNNIRKIEAGYQFDYVNKDIDYKYYDYDLFNQEFSINSGLTNASKFSFSTNALYMTYSDNFWGFMTQFGLRGEYYARKLEQITISNEYTYDKFDLFPTFHVSRKLGQTNQMQFSYSRRINRPPDQMLNPFPDYTDDYFLSQGNPYLKPQYTNSYELNYTKTINRTFVTIESYYRQTDDVFARTMELQDNGVLLLTHRNINKDYLYGVELSVNTALFKWWRLYAGSNFYNYNLVQTTEDEVRNTNVFDLNFQSTFIIDPTTYIQLTGYYTGPKISYNGKQKEFYTTGISVRKDLFQRKLSLVLNMRDVFGADKYEFEQNGVNFSTKGYYVQESPTVMLTVSYKFNNYKSREAQTDGMDIDMRGGL